MAYIFGDRLQSVLFPPSVEDYISADDPVRAYDAFVDQLNLSDLGIVVDNNQLGPPEFDPHLMLKILVYGTSYGIRSSRKLEQACHHNLSFIWLSGNLKPDHQTIARFRRNNRDALSLVLKQCARLCLKLKLIEGNTLFIDSTKIKANASVDHSWNQQRCNQLLKHADDKIVQILNDMEKIDQKELHKDSLVQMEKNLHNKQELKKRVAEILDQLKQENKDSLNTTDPDCLKVKDKQTYTAGYSMQAAVDNKYGLIVNTDVVQHANDFEQLSNQVKQANITIGGTCSTVCADAGYADTQELKKVSDQNIHVVVPSQRQALKEPPGPFSKDKFIYNSNNDTYTCPSGKILRYSCTDGYARKFRIASAKDCQVCPHFGQCTSNNKGRMISRLVLEKNKEKFEQHFLENKHLMQKRKEKAELPFGHIKRNLGVQSFLMRGLKSVQAEAGLLCTAFNLRRMISLLGTQGLIQAFNSVSG